MIRVERVVASVVLLAVAISGALSAGRDGEIARAIRERFVGDPELMRSKIEVEVDAGLVILTGRVASLASRRRALLAAGRVHGVLDVVDRVELDTPRRSDTAVLDDVQELMRDRLRLGDSGLTAEVNHGIVTFAGSVDDARLRIRARSLAESVAGVIGVELAIETPQRDDATIEAGLVALLAHRIHARVAGEIAPAVTEGVATLSGTVPRPYERTLAEEIAWGVNGVVDVLNELEIAPRSAEVPLVRP